MRVHRAHNGRAFTHRGRNALRGARPQVPDGEQPWLAGLERQRRPPQHVPPLVEPLGIEPSIGDHEAAVIEVSAIGEPARRGVDAYEREQGSAFEHGVAVDSPDSH